MAKKRLKSDKIRVRKKLLQTTQKSANNKDFLVKSLKKGKIEDQQMSNLFNYDPKLINQDLKKTLLVTLVVLVVLALITLRYT
jgi:hypothetical protein